ncbi:phosphoribosylformylglycinamidine synthase subunit PurS [uncultured Helicobacter sp.]|uniref:phosphoribosylformylglycinamidine synthase subunit PurS n=1 Tax=uncultured Helicobacter sp. TaxID=175537 RepID=UPI00258C3B49|nr:phosphoribosylformylglycinamidine synthase subunit PurS [uncultured Helicobacter sp.]
MYAQITIKLKNGVLDPQAKAIHNAISSLGFNDVNDVIMQKQILLQFTDNNAQHALQQATNIAKDLLSNPVIEDYEIALISKD